MKPTTPLAMIILFLSSAGVPAAASDALDPGAGACRTIRAEIDLTHGTIAGNFGLDGTVAFVGDGAGTPPPTAPAGSSVFSGILTITTAHGDLLVRETGMFSSRTGNPAGALLTSFGETTGGTQRYDDVTGDLFFAGRKAGAVFLVQVTGELCHAK